MSDPDDSDRVREAIAEGLDKESADVQDVLSAIKQTPLNYFDLVKQSAAFLKDLALTETPSDPEVIHELSKDEVIFSTYRANFFEKIRMPALTDDQLEHFLMRAYELWGEHPTEPMGRWVDWCLWAHLDRRRNGVPFTEVIAGDKTTEDMKQAWIQRHLVREERRRLQKVDNYDRYETPEDVPKSIHELIMSPFIEEPEMAEIAIDTGESAEEQEIQRPQDQPE